MLRDRERSPPEAIYRVCVLGYPIWSIWLAFQAVSAVGFDLDLGFRVARKYAILEKFRKKNRVPGFHQYLLTTLG